MGRAAAEAEGSEVGKVGVEENLGVEFRGEVEQIWCCGGREEGVGNGFGSDG